MPSTNPISMSFACQNDEAAIIGLLKSRLAETNRLTPKTEQSVETMGRQLFQKIIANPDYEVVVGKTPTGEAVCTASLYLLPMIRRGKYILFVEYVFVSKPYRSKGIGRQLMTYITKVAQQKGAETIKLCTNKDSEGTHQFYEKQGYRYTDRLMRKDV